MNAVLKQGITAAEVDKILADLANSTRAAVIEAAAKAAEIELQRLNAEHLAPSVARVIRALNKATVK